MSLDRKFLEAQMLYEKKIADLEAKLAEKEERINWLVEQEFNRKWAKKYVEMRRKEDPMLCLPDSDEVYEKYFELKRQLAEKEKEYDIKYKHWIEEIRESDRLREELAKTNKEWAQSIHDWKEVVKKKDKEIESLEIDLEAKDFNINDLMERRKIRERTHKKDKISFAVEKLQEVKEWVDKMLNGWKTNQEVHPYQRDGIRLALENVEIKIDNQIKQLKEIK